MKIIVYALIAYVASCAIVLMLPASVGYDSVMWKFLLAQFYAVPVAVGITLPALYMKIHKS